MAVLYVSTASLIQPLVWELLYAALVIIKRKKKKGWGKKGGRDKSAKAFFFS